MEGSRCRAGQEERVGPPGADVRADAGSSRLDDIFAAYRKVPSSQPEFTTVAYWSVAHQRVEFTEVFGHPFGLLASVVNFHRVPTLLCAVARRVLAVPVDHFFDDYICVEPASGRGSAQDALKAVHDIVRFGLAPKKRKASAQTNVELGVVCDMSRAASDGVVSFSPTESRVEGVLGSLRRARAATSCDGNERPNEHALSKMLLCACTYPRWCPLTTRVVSMRLVVCLLAR